MMRDRLIEIVKNIFHADFSGTDEECFADFADRLLDHGVICPPCKAGDTAYSVIITKNGNPSHIHETKVVGLHLGAFPNSRQQKRKEYLIVHNDSWNTTSHIPFDKIGKTVFFARQEAEKVFDEAERAFKEREN